MRLKNPRLQQKSHEISDSLKLRNKLVDLKAGNHTSLQRTVCYFESEYENAKKLRCISRRLSGWRKKASITRLVGDRSDVISPSISHLTINVW